MAFPIFLVLAGLVAVVFALSGGIGATSNLTQTIVGITAFMKEIPPIVWVAVGLVILFKLVGGKKR